MDLHSALTIRTFQHAMRVHIYRCMETNPRDPLPPPHDEDTEWDPKSPIRFVWSRTLRQSSHNTAMKERIISDIMGKRLSLYKDVPATEFDKKKLDSTFDQAFKTLKEKWKTQTDASRAVYQKVREDTKAMKSRRRERKKTVGIACVNSGCGFLHPQLRLETKETCRASQEVRRIRTLYL